MQVAATAPRFVRPEDVPAELAAEKDQLCLLLQPYIRDQAVSIQDLVKQRIAKLGENIVVRRFSRLEVGG